MKVKQAVALAYALIKQARAGTLSKEASRLITDLTKLPRSLRSMLSSAQTRNLQEAIGHTSDRWGTRALDSRVPLKDVLTEMGLATKGGHMFAPTQGSGRLYKSRALSTPVTHHGYGAAVKEVPGSRGDFVVPNTVLSPWMHIKVPAAGTAIREHHLNKKLLGLMEKLRKEEPRLAGLTNEDLFKAVWNRGLWTPNLTHWPAKSEMLRDLAKGGMDKSLRLA